VGNSSDVELGAESASLNVQFLRSKPYDEMSPWTATGVGRMKASAARRPRTSPSSFFELIRSGVIVFCRLEGLMLSVSVECALEKVGEFVSSDARESAGEKAPAGTALSSTE
jgi:hypothetical protein